MWHQMGWPARIVVIVLFIMSAWSIGVMIDRWIAFSSARKQSRVFAPAVAGALKDGKIDEAISIAEQNKRSHLAKVVTAALPPAARAADGRAPCLAGDVAFLLEPDLKESHGGLRDVSVLRAISAFAPLLAEYADLVPRRQRRSSPTSGWNSTAWLSASTTSSSCRTRTRWRRLSVSSTPTH